MLCGHSISPACFEVTLSVQHTLRSYYRSDMLQRHTLVSTCFEVTLSVQHALRSHCRWDMLRGQTCFEALSGLPPVREIWTLRTVRQSGACHISHPDPQALHTCRSDPHTYVTASDPVTLPIQTHERTSHGSPSHFRSRPTNMVHLMKFDVRPLCYIITCVPISHVVCYITRVAVTCEVVT